MRTSALPSPAPASATSASPASAVAGAEPLAVHRRLPARHLHPGVPARRERERGALARPEQRRVHARVRVDGGRAVGAVR
jgi:hypothetical protein